MGGHAGSEFWLSQLAFAIPIYLAFVVYPVSLGPRTGRDIEPWLAAVLASVPFFFQARHTMTALGLGGVVGILPLLQALLMALLLLRLLNLEPPGSRSLGRLALVALALHQFVLAGRKEVRRVCGLSGSRLRSPGAERSETRHRRAHLPHPRHKDRAGCGTVPGCAASVWYCWVLRTVLHASVAHPMTHENDRGRYRDRCRNQDRNRYRPPQLVDAGFIFGAGPRTERTFYLSLFFAG